MNKRLLTDKEIAEPTTDEEKGLYTSLSEMELGRQDAKTLKVYSEYILQHWVGVETEGEGWVRLTLSFAEKDWEALKQGGIEGDNE